MTTDTEKKEKPVILDYTIVSPLTNRPIDKNNPEDTLPDFYCSLCEKKLSNPTNAIQHFTGKSHTAMVKLKQEIFQQETPNIATVNLKRPYDSKDGTEPLESYSKSPKKKKKKKETVEPEIQIENSLHCKICNNVFNSQTSADQHYQGRRHKSKLGGSSGKENETHKKPATVDLSVNENGTSAQSAPMKISVNENELSILFQAVESSQVVPDPLTNDSFSVVKPLESKSKALVPKKNNLSENNLHCKVCDNVFNSQASADQHYQGKKHQAAIAGMPFKKKDSSAKNLPIVSQKDSKSVKQVPKNKKIVEQFIAWAPAGQHSQGKKNKADLENLKESSAEKVLIGSKSNFKRGVQKLESNSKSPVEKKKKSNVESQNQKEYKCKLCNNTFNSQISADQHYRGKKHQEAVAAASGKGSYSQEVAKYTQHSQREQHQNFAETSLERKGSFSHQIPIFTEQYSRRNAVAEISYEEKRSYIQQRPISPEQHFKKQATADASFEERYFRQRLISAEQLDHRNNVPVASVEDKRSYSPQRLISAEQYYRRDIVPEVSVLEKSSYSQQGPISMEQHYRRNIVPEAPVEERRSYSQQRPESQGQHYYRDKYQDVVPEVSFEDKRYSQQRLMSAEQNYQRENHQNTAAEESIQEKRFYYHPYDREISLRAVEEKRSYSPHMSRLEEAEYNYQREKDLYLNATLYENNASSFQQRPVSIDQHIQRKNDQIANAESFFEVISHQQTPNNVNTNLKRQYDSNSGVQPPESYSNAPETKKNKLTVEPPNVNDLHCKVCNNTFNSVISRDQHFKGKKHKNNLAGEALKNKVSSVQQVPVASSTTNVKGQSFAKYHCTFCDISLNSDEQMTQHCNGIRHKLKSGEIKEPPEWWVDTAKGRGAVANGRGGAAGRGAANRGRGGGRGRGNQVGYYQGQQNGVGRGNPGRPDKSWYNKGGNVENMNPNRIPIGANPNHVAMGNTNPNHLPMGNTNPNHVPMGNTNPNLGPMGNARGPGYRSFDNSTYGGNIDPYAITVPYQSMLHQAAGRYESFAKDSQYDQYYR